MKDQHSANCLTYQWAITWQKLLEILKLEANFDEVNDKLVYGKSVDGKTEFRIINSNCSIYIALGDMFAAHGSWVLDVYIQPKDGH